MILFLEIAHLFWFILRHNSLTCASNVKEPSICTPMSFTCSFCFTRCSQMLRQNELSPLTRNYLTNLLNQQNLCKSSTSFIVTASIDVSHAKNFVLLAKLHVSESKSVKNRSFMKILKSRGPSKDPCGMSVEMRWKVLWNIYKISEIFWKTIYETSVDGNIAKS